MTLVGEGLNIYLQYLHLFSLIRNKKLELALNKKHKSGILKEYFIKLLNTEEQNNLLKNEIQKLIKLK
jgi:hypothetical protein